VGNTYDIAIVGLGPAGATLAQLLDHRHKVVAIDRKDPGGGKCCGGLLSPDAQRILARFDICLPKDILVDPQIFSVRTIDLDNRIEKYYQRFYVNMDRSKFDNFLISLIPENIRICNNTVCTSIKKENDLYRLTLKSGGSESEIYAKIIIGADGANSIVRNTFYGKRGIRKYLSIQEWFDNNSNSASYSCIFDKAITDSYCWTISKDNYFIIGGAFPIKDGGARFEILKDKIRQMGASFGEAVKREGCFVYLNKGLMSTCTGKNGAYLIGEAAGMISPSSLEGISYSMDSGRIMAEIINKASTNIGYKYFFRTLSIRLKLIYKIFKMPFMYNRHLRKLVMKSGIKTIKRQHVK
jgi:flavin-dependent dehydrogenase